LDTTSIKQLNIKTSVMKNIINKIRSGSLLAVTAMAFLTACNKDMPEIPGTPFVTPDPAGSGRALGDTLGTPARANDSLFYRMIVKGGMLATLNNKTTSYTVFVPTNAAVRTFITAISGGLVPAGSPDAVYSGFIQSANFPAASAAGIVSYNIILRFHPPAMVRG
jgi:hypothetical protein